MRKEGEGTNSHIAVKKITPLDQYQLPNGEYLIEWEKSRTGEYYPKVSKDGDWVFSEEFDIRKAIEATWNFDQIHEPMDHQYHATKLGCDNPFPPMKGESKYRRYGDKPAEDEAPSRGRSRGRVDSDSEDEDEDDRKEEPPARRRRRVR